VAVPRPSGSDPVSVAITRHVKPGQVEVFESWLNEIRAVAAGFDGYAGMDVVRPADADNPTYFIILRFDSTEHYGAWHESQERAENRRSRCTGHCDHRSLSGSWHSHHRHDRGSSSDLLGDALDHMCLPPLALSQILRLTKGSLGSRWRQRPRANKQSWLTTVSDCLAP